MRKFFHHQVEFANRKMIWCGDPMLALVEHPLNVKADYRMAESGVIPNFFPAFYGEVRR